jgi:flagellar FliJ protein
MKGYKFKLEALLKIRKLREEECKTEIGRLQVQITQLRNRIGEHDRGIDEAYDAQEIALSEGAQGQEVTFYPYFVEGNRASIRDIKQEIQVLEERVRELFVELNKFRADVKVIEKMKDKDMTKFKKEKIKKEHQDLEEQVQNWKRFVG